MADVWDSLFVLDMSVWEKVIRTVLLYLLLLLLLRVSGKRLIAQLTTFDFILLLLVSNAVQNGLIGNDSTVSGAAIGAGVLFLLNGALAYLLFRSRRAERLISGRAVVVIENGVLDEAELRRQRLTMSDLKIALQNAGAARVKDVKNARLEPNGHLLVRMKEHEGPSRTDLMAAVKALEAKIDALTARLES